MTKSETPKSWRDFCQKTWVIVLAGLFVPPIGMVLAWMKPGWTNRTKWIATGLMVVMLVGHIGSLTEEQSVSKEPVESGTVATAEPNQDKYEVATEQASVDTRPGAGEKPSVDNDFVTQWPKKRTSRKQPVDMTKTFEVRIGMTPDTVRELLGEPHEIQNGLVKGTPFSPQRETSTWTYKGKDKDDFIMIGFTDGVVEAGGAAGWDFEKGFDDSSAEGKKRIVQYYMDFLKRGGRPPFDANNPPVPRGG